MNGQAETVGYDEDSLLTQAEALERTGNATIDYRGQVFTFSAIRGSGKTQDLTPYAIMRVTPASSDRARP